MKPLRATLTLLVAAALLLGASACGGSSSTVPSDAVAVVNGTPIPRATLDSLIAQEKARYEAQKQAFPKQGTQEFQSVQSVVLNYLVQKAEFEQQAKKLGVSVSSKDVDKALATFVKSRARYRKNQALLKKDLAGQGMSLAAFRETLFVSVLSQKIFDKVTKDITVSPGDVAAYYTQNASQYGSPASREVRHILIAVKDKSGKVDFAKSKAKAEQIRKLVTNADFAALAKKYSDDPGSKDSGGKYTDTKGSFVPEFEAVAFSLPTGAISQPVRSQFGYHIIQALAPTKKATAVPYKQVQASIKATLLQSRRNQAMTQWVTDLTNGYKSKVKYATGFAPPNIPTTTDTTTTTQ
jgi:parvulin-like peptidyl-prolyl isomerase